MRRRAHERSTRNEPRSPPGPAGARSLRRVRASASIDVEGGQAADLFAFNAENTDEFLSAQHTRVAEGKIYPEVGWTFVTNERRPILEFTDDTSPGRHDCLAAACDRCRYIQLGGGEDHGSCEENLLAEAREARH